MDPRLREDDNCEESFNPLLRPYHFFKQPNMSTCVHSHIIHLLF